MRKLDATPAAAGWLWSFLSIRITHLDDATTSPPRARWRVALALGGLALLWFVLLRQLSLEWSSNEQYGYGWFVPFFAAFLFWLRWESRPGADGYWLSVKGYWKEERAPNPEPNNHSPITINRAAAAAAAAALLLALLPLRLFEVANPDWRPLSWAHALVVVGLTLLLLWRIGGSGWVRHFAFPVCFIFVAVPWISPIEAPIVQGLMRVVAAIATETLALCGIPAQLEGSVIRIASGVVGVDEACSGVRSLQTSLMIGLLFGELKRLSVARRLILLAAAMAIAFAANCARAFFLVYMAATRGVGAVEQWHDAAGYAILGAVFLGTLGIAAALGGTGAVPSSEERERSTSNAQRPTSNGETAERPRSNTEHRTPNVESLAAPAGGPPIRVPRFAIFLLPILLAIEAGVEAWYRAHERNFVETARWKVNWPEARPGFREVEISEDVRSTLRFDAGREAMWPVTLAPPQESSAATAATSLMFFFRWEPGSASILRARAHRPDACLPNTGWRVARDHGVRVFEVGEGAALPFRHFEFARPLPDGREAIAHTFFCQREDRVPADAAARLDITRQGLVEWARNDRVRVVMQGLRNQGQQVLEVVLTAPQEISASEAQAWFAQLAPEIVKANAEKLKN